jgi:hypothetical protein
MRILHSARVSKLRWYVLAFLVPSLHESIATATYLCLGMSCPDILTLRRTNARVHQGA